ncbi:TPA: prenyltransferase [bacterium]|nr:prenyltransferase [bacterium]
MIRNIINWMILARLPFHIAGLLPFVLGSVIAQYFTGKFDWQVFGLAILAVELIMLTIHYSSEYFDYDVDMLSARYGKSNFSGGSQILQSGVIPRKKALFASFICLIPAIFIGLLLQFRYKTGILTIPFGVIGLFLGLTYSAKPIRWAYRGFGEVVIGFCYGWLTPVTAYYLQTGKIPIIIHLISIPLSLSIFNVILINEFPDYLADRKGNKNNLVVRFGHAKMRKIYTIVSLGICISYFIAIMKGIPIKALFIFSPVILISIITAYQMYKGEYKDKKKLNNMCARTLIVNLCISISIILAILS